MKDEFLVVEESTPVEERVPTENIMTVEEFCKELSGSDRRVEMLGGFFYFMTKAKGINKGTFDELNGYFKAFEKMPV